MRDFLNHEYFGVDPEIVWCAVTDEIPALHNAIETLLGSVQSVRS